MLPVLLQDLSEGRGVPKGQGIEPDYKATYGYMLVLDNIYIYRSTEHGPPAKWMCVMCVVWCGVLWCGVCDVMCGVK